MGSKLSLTPVGKNVLVGSLAMVIALVLAWLFILSPRGDAIAAVNDEVVIAEDKNAALRTQITTLRARQEALPELREVSEALDRRFPPRAQQARLFKMITAAAAEAGIAPQYVRSLTVDAPKAAGGSGAVRLPGVAGSPTTSTIAAQRLTINVSGSAEQIRDMVANLEKLPRAFAVSAITLTQSSAPVSDGDVSPAEDSQTVTITGDMHVMPKVVYPKDLLAVANAAANAAAAVAADAKS